MRNLYLLLSCFFLTISLSANNIQVANISLTGQNTAAQTTDVQFDLSWENSWRISIGPANWDAAWVFVKYRVNGATWRHATLSVSGHVAASGSTVDVTSDLVGAFIYRSADGSGDLDLQDLKLRWNYGEDGVDDNALVDVQVFAIEMVNVPQGEFSVGAPRFGGGDMNGEFYTLSISSPFVIRSPYQISNENAITVASSAGNLYYNNEEGLGEAGIGDQLGPIPASFPKGFAAFYSMKYETTQDQWVSFFNTLTDTQKANLDVTGALGKNSDMVISRNSISWPDAGNATTTTPDLPLNYVAAEMILPYLDWAGLRPMTELEYEKSCRGPLDPVSGELAWGNGNFHNVTYNYENLDTPNEIITNPGEGTGNAVMVITAGTPSGPKRSGIFAASASNNNREETGGSYYGIMELTGNLYERIITVGNPEGRAFTGGHGDGTITNGGTANVTGWPTGALGIGYKGGSFANNIPFIMVSDRTDAANEITAGNTRLGFRGGRTAE